MADITAWHGKSFNEHVTLRDAAAKQGYRFLSLSIYGPTSAPVYAAVMIKRPVVVAQRDWPLMTADQFQQTFSAQANEGYGPVMIAATGSASDPRFAAVFQQFNPIPLTRHLLGSGDPGDTGTIQGMDAQARKQGLMLHWAAAYGDSGNPRYAAIWLPNTDATLWNNDGLADSVAGYQARFNAETSAWCRPSFVTLNASNQYLSVFTDREIGPWVARHNMSPADYQNEFNTWTGKNYFPVCVQAAGSSAGSARFAALFAQSETTVQRQFHATGPVANSGIDAIIQKAMVNSPVKHAALAIVHGTKLVYARGYTNAEPDWPLAQPTTRFRMASVSKTVTALALFQMIDAGTLWPGHSLQQCLQLKLQDILQLKTPTGGAPADNRFGDITIKHLLEHTSGLNADAFRNGLAVQQAFAAAGHPVNLPVSEPMTDSYVASLNLVSAPGATQAYNNCGYYLLSRIVAKKRNVALPVAAFQGSLFPPLGITRIRRAASLVADQPADEARYQSPTLTLGTSQMSNAQPLVPLEYGTEQVGLMEGGGGLSGAATDLARLVAALIDPNDTPMMQRQTLTTMLSDGAAMNAAGFGRAGYGFDGLKMLGGGQFYGQKGGSLPTSNDVLEFNGDWGFVMLWGSPPTAAEANWYPDYPSVMNIAKSTAWGSQDLFPQFGMSSL
jgi:CubicO group peptidase (beta-lactamase class C family)